VIVLNGVVDQAKAPALARQREAALELADQSHHSQRRQPSPHLQGDVAGKARR
jgi:hypothetical protein